jgi:hypothetical protein
MGATAFNITTLSKETLGIMDLIVALIITDTR